MRKLTNGIYGNSRRMTEEQKDELLIPEDYYGLVAIETWNVNGKLKIKGVCVAGGVYSYLLGLGKFKDEATFVKQEKDDE